MKKQNETPEPGAVQSGSMSAYLDLPFARRWRTALDHAMSEQRWHVHTAPSRHGKTTANRAHVRAALREKKADGSSEKPVAQCVATDGKRLILRSLGEMLVDGGERFLRLPNPELRVPALCKALNVRLIIVNNAHNLDWHQWQELLTLDEVCGEHQATPPAIVLSGVNEKLELKQLPKSTELLSQIHNRICCYEEIPGHSAAETGTALGLLLARDCPPLVHKAVEHGTLLFELLTTKTFDRERRGTVSAMDLVEVVRRIAAVYAEAPRTGVAKIIRTAVEDYASRRIPPVMEKSAQVAIAAEALAAAAS